jgi:hypothetical protein
MPANFRSVDLSLENPVFFALSTVQSSNPWVQIPNKALPKSLLSDLAIIYRDLTGEEIDLQGGCTVLGHFSEDGRLKQVYGPAIYLSQSSENFVIRWGNEEIPLTTDGTNFVAGEVTFGLADCEFGKYTDLGLQAAIEVDGDILTFAFPIRKEDYKQVLKAKAVELMLKNGFSSIVDLFKKSPSNTAEGGQVYPTRFLLNGTYEIVVWRPVLDGKKHIWTAKDAKLLTDDGEVLELEFADFWAPAKLQTAITSGLRIGATLTKVALEDDKFRYDIDGDYDFNEDVLDLSWL